MQTQFQNPLRHRTVRLPRCRTASGARRLTFITAAWLIFSGATQLKAQNFADGIVHGQVVTVFALLQGQSLTSSPCGNYPIAMMAVAPSPPTIKIKTQSGQASPAGSPGAGTAGTLYGTASVGGEAGGYGTVFSLNPDGTGFTLLHDFTGGSDGNGPAAGLVLSSNTLYGTTINGGNHDEGVVFAVDTGGTNFTVLHHFTARNYPYTNSDGGNPYCQLILSSNILYGTASDGGKGNSGTVFALNLANTNFTVLHNFAATKDDANDNLTNSDGANPYARLLLSSNTLYGTTSSGGTGGAGTVFAINLANTNFTVLHSFAAVNFLTLTNTDGTSPYDGLILSGNTLYGTASRGGNANGGTVFAVNTDGTDFTNLHDFTGGSDGDFPKGELLLFSNVLIGTASAGGDTSLNDGGHGTIFGLNTNGTGFTVLHTFTAGNFDYALQGSSYLTNSDGANPAAGLIAVSNTLYGTASHGGSGANGTVFNFTFVPPPNLLGLTLSGTNLVLTGTNALPGETSVTLMSSNLTQPLTNWTPVATNVLNVTGSFTFTATNAVDPKAPRRFFILQTR
jgi:uncharacterized repeat protein (TIGR03803 family)